MEIDISSQSINDPDEWEVFAVEVSSAVLLYLDLSDAE